MCSIGSLLRFAGALVFTAQSLGAQGLGYTLTPAATSVRWSDALGLENSSLLGGQLAFDFERYVSLQGYYFTNKGLRTAVDKLGLSGSIASTLANQKLDVRSFGANLIVNLGTGTIVPFVKGGGGVLEFRPQSPETGTVNAGPTRQAALTLGGGLRLAILGPVRVDVFAEDLMFRVNRYALAAQVAGVPTGSGPVPPDPEESKTRHNVVLGAGLSIPFGPGHTKDEGPSQLYQWGLSGASFAFEPMVGRLFFGGDQNIGDQDLAGVRAGVDLGRLVGLRTFYWRGTNGGFSRTEPLQSWGAEAQMRLNAGPGITPFLLLGGARLDFKSPFRTSNGATVEDQNSLIAGGGVSFPVAERLAVNVSARDYMFAQSTLDSVASVSELRSNLRHNWLLSAGLRFSIGGQSDRQIAKARETELRTASAREARTQLVDSLRRDSIAEAAIVARTTRDSVRVAAADTVLERADERVATPVDDRRRSRDSTSTRDFTSGRVVTIPVPTEGELYVRYGPPGATAVPGIRSTLREGSATSRMTNGDPSDAELREEIRALLREEVSAELTRMDDARVRSGRARTAPAVLDDARLSAIETRVVRRMEAMNAERARSRSDVRLPIRKGEVSAPTDSAPSMTDAQLEARIDARMSERIDAMVDRRVRDELARQPRDTIAVRTIQPTPFTRVDTVRLTRHESGGEVVNPTRGPALVTAYSGGSFSSGNQGLFGVRVDLGPVSRNFSGFHFVPELALGFGAGARSTMLAGNVIHQFSPVRVASLPGIAPHVGAGLGLLNFSDPVGTHDGLDAVLNVEYGATVDLWSRDGAPGPGLLIEHQGVQLFDLNRLLVGLSWQF